MKMNGNFCFAVFGVSITTNSFRRQHVQHVGEHISHSRSITSSLRDGRGESKCTLSEADAAPSGQLSNIVSPTFPESGAKFNYSWVDRFFLHHKNWILLVFFTSPAFPSTHDFVRIWNMKIIEAKGHESWIDGNDENLISQNKKYSPFPHMIQQINRHKREKKRTQNFISGMSSFTCSGCDESAGWMEIKRWVKWPRGKFV